MESTVRRTNIRIVRAPERGEGEGETQAFPDTIPKNFAESKKNNPGIPADFRNLHLKKSS